MAPSRTQTARREPRKRTVTKTGMSYDQKVAWTRAKIRKIVTKRYRAACGVDDVTMHWNETYWTNVVEQHGVLIEGWPDELVAFGDLNRATSSLPRLELLWLRWKVGAVRFRPLGDDERAAFAAAGLFARTVRPPRADKGLIKGRRRDPATRSKRLKPYAIKTPLVVPDGADDTDRE